MKLFLLSVLLFRPLLCADRTDPGGWDKAKWRMSLADVRKAYESGGTDVSSPGTDRLIINIKISDPSSDMQATVRASESSHLVSSTQLRTKL